MSELRKFSRYFHENREKISALIFDIDGTVALNGRPLPGAIELFNTLNEEKFPYFILTNDSSLSCAQKAAIQIRHGFPISAENIVSAGNALEIWAKENYRGGCFFSYGQLGDPSYTELAGITTISDPDKIMDCCGVIAGECCRDMHISLEAVFNFFIAKPDAPYIVTNPDSYWPGGRFGMGFGAGGEARFVTMLLAEAGIKKEPVYLGKPYSTIYDYALKKLSFSFPAKNFSDRKSIVMLGDSLYADVCGANRAGLTSALLMSGITNENMLLQAGGELIPDMIFDSL